MKCPYCNRDNTRVIDSRPAEENNSIRRRRACDECGKRFTTYEKIETNKLKDLDAVAYVRFASVYREFKDVNTFMDELKKMLE